jgi:uncharacterized membrane protein
MDSMPSTDTPPALTDRIFAGALILSTGLQIAESLIPCIPLFPWLRLGMSWAILLPFLLSFGVRPAIALFLARNVLSLTFGGQPPSTFLVSSLSGVFALLLAGGALRKGVASGWLGWIGAGVALAACFNGLQLGAVTAVLVGHSGNFFQLGPILAWSVLSGALVAWLAKSFWSPDLWERIGKIIENRVPSGEPTKGALRKWSLLMWTILCAGPFALGSWRLEIALAIALAAYAWTSKGPRGCRILWQSWPYFAFLAWLHLMDTPGHFLSGTPITSEGLVSFARHAGRLASFLLASQELVRLVPWQRIAPGSRWARGIGLALPLLPGLFPSATRATREWWRQRGSSDRPSLAEAILRGLDPEPDTPRP